MTRELSRILKAFLVAFLLVALSAAFWTVIQADSMLARSDNQRNVIDIQRIERGTIFDRQGVALAYSHEAGDDRVERVYPYPETASAAGYYSFKYGVDGIEAAFDGALRGDDLRTTWQEVVDDSLHRPQQGADVQSTLDLDVQQAAAEALGDRSGAVIVVMVPSGEILGMVSRPGFDPNTLDANWDALTQDKDTAPLLNRVTAGLYQPGGSLQTVILAAILASYTDLEESGGYVLNTETTDAEATVQVDDLLLTCLPDTPDRPLTLAEAYAFGCPAPFVQALGTMLTPSQIGERFEALGLLAAPELAGFATTAGAPSTPLAEGTAQERLVAAVTGQGELTVTPLQMVQIVAAIANQGNAVPLHLVTATRAPGSEDWQPVELPVRRPALLRADVASGIRLTMLQAAAQSPFVSRAVRGDQVLYGHSARAYAGPDETPYVWFTGFVDVTQEDEAAAIAVVVVVEDENDPGVAADVAGAALETAGQSVAVESSAAPQ
jgi:peptidoglycan glycosyltransferase